MTDRPGSISLISVFGTLPWLVFGLPAGVYADRRNRFHIMVTADVARTIVLVLAVVLALTHKLTFVCLLLFAGVMGVGEVLFDCAALAVIPTLVQPNQIAEASGRFVAVHTGGKDLVGYTLAGPLFTLSRVAPLVADAMTFAGSALIISQISRRVRTIRAPSSPRSISAQLKDGVPALLRDRRMAYLTAIAAVLNLVFLGQISIMAVFTVKVLTVAPEMLGVLLLAGAVGGVCGSLLAARVWTAVGDFLTILVSLIVAGLADMAIAVGNIWIVSGCLLFNGMATSMYHVVAGAVRLTIIPDELLGRTAGAYRMFTWGAMPLGSFSYGLIAQMWGLELPFVLGGFLVILMTPICARVFRDSNIRAYSHV